jgi:hypothetical protein
VPHDANLTDELARYFLRKAYQDGEPPFNDAAWLRGAREELERRNSPEKIARKVEGIRARMAGKSLTCCREVRGTHACSYIYDPAGTDPPPSWWSLDEAKRYEAGRASPV